MTPDFPPADLPLVNTHVHLPPNFSAFADVDAAIAQAVAEGIAALGISNFYDQRVYGWFGQAAAAAGIVALYGLEIIAVAPDLAAGVRVNDPANPGRFYLCGKGVDPDRAPTASAQATTDVIRTGNDTRAAAMIARVAAALTAAGVAGADRLEAAGLTRQVASRAGVPPAWVSLQERHIAQAVQQVLADLDPPRRGQALERLYGQPSAVDPDDPVGLQTELRARLLKAGRPGFVPEVPIGFDQAYDYVLARGGIPTYPVLADGADPLCQFETPPDSLAQALLDRGIHAAELIPPRNTTAVVDDYVRALTEAGLVVMAGTEHNTTESGPLAPACADADLSDFARQHFWRGTCVVAAHQEAVRQGQPGFVDATGRLTRRPVDDLVASGAAIIGARPTVSTQTTLSKEQP